MPDPDVKPTPTPKLQRIPSIVYSTTRSWNCGDDFILFGVRRLIDATLPAHNPIIFNRHPDQAMGRVGFGFPKTQELQTPNGPVTVRFNPYQLAKDYLWKWDNSVREGFDARVLSACIFAGTPEWRGTALLPLVRAALACRLPTAYLGIGMHDDYGSGTRAALTKEDRELLGRAGLITTRDRATASFLEEFGAAWHPCPSIHAADAKPRQPGAVLRIALSMQCSARDTPQPISQPVYDATLALFRRLAERFDCSLILHYVDEVPEFSAQLGGIMPIRYAYDPRDYLELYAGFDLTVTTRVHGAGICAALGVPAYLIRHTVRSETGEGFLAKIIDPTAESVDDIAQRIGALEIGKWSQEIVAHQAADRDAMLGKLKRFFAPAEDQPPAAATTVL